MFGEETKPLTAAFFDFCKRACDKHVAEAFDKQMVRVSDMIKTMQGLLEHEMVVNALAAARGAVIDSEVLRTDRRANADERSCCWRH